MSADIPFDRSFDLPPETAEGVVPGVRRLLANNPGPFTFKGTVSYIVGQGQVAIIDPGPLDETHIAAVLDAVRGETVTHIFVTHTHRDHSPAVPRIKAATGALVLAEGAHRPAPPAPPRRGAAHGREQRPRVSARAHARRWRGRHRPGLDHRGGDDAWPYRQSHGLCAQRGRSPVLGRSRHGVVDARGRAAGW